MKPLWSDLKIGGISYGNNADLGHFVSKEGNSKQLLSLSDLMIEWCKIISEKW